MIGAILAIVSLVVGSFLLYGNNFSNEQAFADYGRSMSDEELRSFFEPLGPVPEPEDNPITEEKVELGLMLFVDPRLSKEDQLSCLTCHSPQLGYADNLTFSVGFDHTVLTRNTPSIINTGYYETFFWDGRADSLEEQSLGPIQDPNEMNLDLDTMIEKVRAVEGYRPYFDAAFGGEISIDTVAKALATFQRTINIDNTAFDRFLDGEDQALDEQEKFGMELFITQDCIECHSGPNFTDQEFHNAGVNSGDPGLAEISGDEEDLGKFRTPGLRGIIYTAPYMHDGSEVTLHDVVNFYDRGGNGEPNTSELIRPLHLSIQEKEALVAFLRAISGTPPEIEIPSLPQ
ncbi:hypothetical protein BKP35_11140 [Anaerobacillus arseniciselenatis]|uniref:Methylamine utilization protein MauG n=2 Tax=Anaerobacillus arseniciselenatis TaxID=85682 RepID=A0A1S2LK16_9BACI|nr:hypothetical protein BKP35_11140 [Anaerobacillus arseniciselenatis]